MDKKIYRWLFLYIASQVMLLGDSGVGKTCVLVRFKDGAFLSGSFISTVGIDYKVNFKTPSEQTERFKKYSRSATQYKLIVCVVIQYLSTSFWRYRFVLIVLSNLQNKVVEVDGTKVKLQVSLNTSIAFKLLRLNYIKLKLFVSKCY